MLQLLPLLLAVIPSQPESGFPSAGRFAGSNATALQGNGVAIAPRWVLTCAHGGHSAFFVQGSARLKIVRWVDHPRADLALAELEQPVKHFSKPLYASFEKLKGREFTIVGWGETGVRFPYGYDGRLRTGGVKRSATNTLDELRTFDRYANYKTELLVYDIDQPGSANKGTLGGKATRREGGMGSGDSGGPWYVFEGGKPRVVGITVYTLGHPSGGGGHAFAWGAQGGGVNLYAYRDWITSATGMRPQKGKAPARLARRRSSRD